MATLCPSRLPKKVAYTSVFRGHSLLTDKRDLGDGPNARLKAFSSKIL